MRKEGESKWGGEEAKAKGRKKMRTSHLLL